MAIITLVAIFPLQTTLEKFKYSKITLILWPFTLNLDIELDTACLLWSARYTLSCLQDGDSFPCWPLVIDHPWLTRLMKIIWVSTVNFSVHKELGCTEMSNSKAWIGIPWLNIRSFKIYDLVQVYDQDLK